jgi:Uncharacterised nucleotidyltransferase
MGRPHPALLDLAAGRPPHVAPGDVSELMASAREHRMTGLIAMWVNDGTLTLPHDDAIQLAAYNLRVRAHHHRLWDTLDSVTDELDGIGVEVASFKGVTAEARWYDSVGQRPSGDLDLFLPPIHHGRIEEIMALFQPDHTLAGKAGSLVESGQIQHLDLQTKTGVAVDLHVDLLKILIAGRQQEEFWERTVMDAHRGQRLHRVIDAETSLIQSLLHLTKDRFSILLGFVDVVRIVQREDLDWRYIDRISRAEGLETPVHLALETVFDTLNLAGPPIPVVRTWRSSLWRVLWGPKTQLHGTVGRVSRHRRQFWIPLLARGRFREALGRLWRLAFPPPELMAHYHPDLQGPYLWHLIRGRLRRQSERRREVNEAGQVGS